MDFFLDGPIPTAALFGDFIFRDDNHNLIDGTVFGKRHDSGSSIINLAGGIGDFSVIGFFRLPDL